MAKKRYGKEEPADLEDIFQFCLFLKKLRWWFGVYFTFRWCKHSFG